MAYLLVILCTTTVVSGTPTHLGMDNAVDHTRTVSGSVVCPATFSVRVGAGPMRDTALNLTEVAWSGPECHGVFLGSASIVKTPTGTLLTGSDLFGAVQVW